MADTHPHALAKHPHRFSRIGIMGRHVTALWDGLRTGIKGVRAGWPGRPQQRVAPMRVVQELPGTATSARCCGTTYKVEPELASAAGRAVEAAVRETEDGAERPTIEV